MVTSKLSNLFEITLQRNALCDWLKSTADSSVSSILVEHRVCPSNLFNAANRKILVVGIRLFSSLNISDRLQNVAIVLFSENKIFFTQRSVINKREKFTDTYAQN